MNKWVRFEHNGNIHFGQLEDEQITRYEGDMFNESKATDEVFTVDTVSLLAPCSPSKIIALWNNFYALAEKQGNEIPEAPYYFIKPSSCVVGIGSAIIPPASYSGRIFYEGELGIVIGQKCKEVNESQAEDYIFGYTCVNDVTAMQLIHEKKAFEQWTRAKSFDTFGVIGPCISTLINVDALTVRTLVNGRERQNYPIKDMIFSPAQLVSLLSEDMTLEAGDVIACGTSLGAMPMKGNTKIEVIIDGIGVLENTYLPE
ncbi:MAG: 2-keto-4-pentenoate hydratase/2-oxohepta-3-ene-1,7-dioic acid hydratase in catechol pathway [Gammaproteobacteria bacterium]|jgi:2-keto-4-pentenoate hydratase/2-oxohepta-3-ene-1,7-dioic acid hydratase in catechol pathway